MANCRHSYCCGTFGRSEKTAARQQLQRRLTQRDAEERSYQRDEMPSNSFVGNSTPALGFQSAYFPMVIASHFPLNARLAETIGFMGLGQMGLPIALNLLSAGFGV